MQSLRFLCRRLVYSQFVCSTFVCSLLLLSSPLTASALEAPPVAIEKFAFAPKEITIAPGTTVVWTNHDETPHTISAGDKSFVSKAMDTEDRYEHTFATEGDFAYFCTLHPFMTGVVHVRASPASSKAAPGG